MILSSRSARPAASSASACLQVGGERFLEVLGGFARLAGVGFVDDDGKALPFELGHGLGDDGELLQGGDDDGLALFQGFSQLGRVLVDLLDHARGLLELLDGVLKLLVEHPPVGDHDDGVEQALCIGWDAGRSWPAGGRARRWSWICRSRRSAGRDSSGPRRPA